MTADATISIVQGDLAVSADPDVIMTTVLGSCVAACIFDQRAGIGGMNHFMLVGSDQMPTDDPKYGIAAMTLLVERILRSGGQHPCLQAKLFGGAHLTHQNGGIGHSNAVFAQQYLKDAGIPCISQSVGGVLARRIQFTPSTGVVRQLRVTDTIEVTAGIGP